MRATGIGLLLLVACAGAPPVESLVPATAPGKPVATLRHNNGWIDVQLDFDPPLDAPGLLVVEHEAGVRLELLTGRTGIVFRLPPGPAAFRLTAGDRVHELPVLVRDQNGDAQRIVMSTRLQTALAAKAKGPVDGHCTIAIVCQSAGPTMSRSRS